MFDLSDIPLIDNHCHQLVHGFADLDAIDWQSYFTESADAGMRARHTATTLAFRRTAKLLAAELDVDPCLPPDELTAAVVAARTRLGDGALATRLLRGINAATFLLDDGYPRVAHYGEDEFRTWSDAATAGISRLEPAVENLIPLCEDVDELAARFLAHLDGLPANTVGLKTAIAYRTGLAIKEWSDTEVTASFQQARRDVAPDGRFRLAHRPLHEHLLRLALRWASNRAQPVQIHTGYGDADLDLRLSDPAHLQGLLADPSLAELRLVLLHGAWPYTREGAYMAATYEGVYLDVSYAVPYLSTAEFRAETSAALSLAPTSKLLYSSDGVCLPDLHWTSAHAGRRALAEALSQAVDESDLSWHEAGDIAAAMLADNARELYSL
jgi:uncharacterized protein